MIVGRQPRAFGICFGAVVVAYFAANIIGFCYKDFRLYTDSDLIERFIDVEIATHRAAIANTVQTPKDFIANYPDCCKVAAGQQALNWLMVVLGAGMRDVYLTYPLLIDENLRQYTVIYSTDCCAGVWAKRTDY
ncbi:hypothetical protein [Rhizobium sp. 2MFCol3.1]|uniref:hypothetical protein n=1 Tax=Rhizobium sp. 2MFCol3.1 TaxID=1246459 RepID=UPI0003608586|nr:hypothetical protein [Rhizobium sp. 2MFCol3.1]